MKRKRQYNIGRGLKATIRQLVREGRAALERQQEQVKATLLWNQELVFEDDRWTWR